MRRSSLVAMLAAGALSLAPAAMALGAGPADTLVRERFVDYPRERPGPEAQAGGRTQCQLPASDLCTDWKDGRLRWAEPTVGYRVNTSGAPTGAVTAVRAGFDAWEDEAKSSAVAAVYPGDRSQIDYEYQGASSARGAALDGSNVVSFANLSSSCSGCLAVTTYWYYLGTRQLAEFDITMNTAYAWSTTGAADRYDVQNVVTHEAGHTLVLGDLYKAGDAALTMYGYAGAGETAKRDLGAGDVLGLRKAYGL